MQVDSGMLKKIAIYAGGFILLNILLWGGQEIYYREDTAQIADAKERLSSMEVEISMLEAGISDKESEINSLEARMNQYESAGRITEYNANVDRYNSLLTSYNMDFTRYESRIAAYNNFVNETNVLIERSGSRWYLIPIPIGGTKKIQTRDL